jgi:hypothetical protein
MSAVDKRIEDRIRSLGIFIAKQIVAIRNAYLLQGQIFEKVAKTEPKTGTTDNEILETEIDTVVRNLSSNLSWMLRVFIPLQIHDGQPFQIAKAFCEGIGLGIARSRDDPVLAVLTRNEEGSRFLELLPPSVAASFQPVHGKVNWDEVKKGEVLFSKHSGKAARVLNDNAKIIIGAIIAEYKRKAERNKLNGANGQNNQGK